MTSLTIRNENEEPLCVFVEPLGEDFWIAAKGLLRFTATASQAEIDSIWHSRGVSVWLSDAVVTTESGRVVECGFQRPPGAFDN